MATPDYPKSTWHGAYSGNYTNASRPGSNPINKIIIHVTQGSWSSAINWFRDSRAGVSAHYTVRSSDGHIGQSVQENDIAYHAGNWSYNQTSIGIEHEGYVSNSSWFTDKMYNSSAKLSAYLCKKYKIPIDRSHILGHNQVPGATHTDPGGYWNWDRYIKLVKYYAGSQSTSTKYSQTVDNNTSGRFSASSRWIWSSWDSQRYGRNYRVLKKPLSFSDNAKYKIRTPSKGSYKVWARWPADVGYNDRTRFFVKTTSGWKVRRVNQRANGGKWVLLGTYTLGQGDSYRIVVSSKSSGKGYIVADAIRIVKT